MLQESTTQEEWEVAWRTVGHSDIGRFLPLLVVPTLVIGSRGHSLLRPEQSMELAGQIPNARMTIIDGGRPFGDPTQLLQAIEGFLSDLGARDPDAASTAGAMPHSGLSAREIEVMRLLAAGRSNQQIADELVISLNTVRRHVSNIFDKTGVANRTEAAVYARDHGIG